MNGSDFPSVLGDVYGDDIVKLNKKGRKRAQGRNNQLGSLDLNDSDSISAAKSTKSSKVNGSSGDTKTTGYKSKYAQPVVGSYN